MIKRSHRERLLYITILYAADVELAEIPVLAKLTGVPSLWLDTTLEKARLTLADKIQKREKYRNQRNEYWYNIMRSKNRMESSVSGSSMRSVEYWAKKTHTWQRRYHIMTRRLAALKVVVSHKDIGKLLNTPTGSIASGLYQIRQELSQINMDMNSETLLEY